MFCSGVAHPDRGRKLWTFCLVDSSSHIHQPCEAKDNSDEDLHPSCGVCLDILFAPDVIGAILEPQGLLRSCRGLGKLL